MRPSSIFRASSLAKSKRLPFGFLRAAGEALKPHLTLRRLVTGTDDAGVISMSTWQLGKSEQELVVAVIFLI
jgi:hypothetical protein